MPVYTESDGIGKATLEEARKIVGVNTFTSEIQKLAVHSEITSEIEVSDTSDYNLKLGIPEVNEIEEFSNTSSIDDNGLRKNVIHSKLTDNSEKDITIYDGVGIKEISTNAQENNAINVNIKTTDGNIKTFALNGFYIQHTYLSIEEMENDFDSLTVSKGCFCLIDTGSVEDSDTGKLYFKGSSKWQYIGDLSGSQGIQGPRGYCISSFESEESEISDEYNTYIPILEDGTKLTDFPIKIKNGTGIKEINETFDSETNITTVNVISTSDKKLGTFSVKNAGFDTPEATISLLEVGSSAYANIESSGDSTSKKFKFNFGIPKVVSAETATSLIDNNGNIYLAKNDNNEVVIDSAMKKMLLDFTYPVGSLYWSSKSTNPSKLFGGTWTQIKDRVVLAAGDTYKVGTTGGSATVTLAVANLPNHTHSCSSDGSHSHTTNSQNTSTTDIESKGHTHSYSFDLTHKHAQNINGKDNDDWGESKRGQGNQIAAKGVNSFASYDAVGYEAGTNSMYWSDGWRVYTDETTLSISKSTDGISNHHTHSYSHSHETDSKGSHSHTIGSTGSGTSFSILPPYVVKYCWERTA